MKEGLFGTGVSLPKRLPHTSDKLALALVLALALAVGRRPQFLAK